jgi:hypothetical protein
VLTRAQTLYVHNGDAKGLRGILVRNSVIKDLTNIFGAQLSASITLSHRRPEAIRHLPHIAVVGAETEVLRVATRRVIA